MCLWSTDAVITSTGIFIAIHNNMSQNNNFSYMPKIIRMLRSCSMKIFCTVNISKLNYWLVICIAKNNFKGDFLNIEMFLHHFQILSKPCINGNIIYSAFRWSITLSFWKCTVMVGFMMFNVSVCWLSQSALVFVRQKHDLQASRY